jgi:hypothetical protein
MRILIIGNGGAVLNTLDYHYVQSFDKVVRLNWCRVEGFEESVGEKRDILGFIPSGAGRDMFMKRALDSEIKAYSDYVASRPKEIAESWVGPVIDKYNIHEDTFSYTNTEAFARLRSGIEAHRARLRRGKCNLPSTGTSIIAHILHTYPEAEVFIAGFDQWRSGHYWESGHMALNKPYHPVVEERCVIDDWVKQGRLKHVIGEDTLYNFVKGRKVLLMGQSVNTTKHASLMKEYDIIARIGATKKGDILYAPFAEPTGRLADHKWLVNTTPLNVVDREKLEKFSNKHEKVYTVKSMYAKDSLDDTAVNDILSKEPAVLDTVGVFKGRLTVASEAKEIKTLKKTWYVGNIEKNPPKRSYGEIVAMERSNENRVFEEYNDFLKGKNVILVGPANTLVGAKQGKFIDSFDVIVRLNKSYRVDPDMYEDLGSRTDVLYNCMYPSDSAGGGVAILDMPFIQAQEYKYIVCSYPMVPAQVMAFRMRNRQQTPFTAINRGLHQEVAAGCKGKPNTGTVTIFDLISRPVKSLYVTGVTFFRTAYHEGYRTGDHILENVTRKCASNTHPSTEGQFNYFAETAAKDSKIRLDPFLTKAIDDYNKRKSR